MRPYRPNVKVELLWFPGCPNWQETGARLRQAVPLAGVDADVELVEVTTPEDAERLRFRGSPTVLVDGTDPFASEPDAVGLSCRVSGPPRGCAARRPSTCSSQRCGARR